MAASMAVGAGKVVGRVELEAGEGVGGVVAEGADW